LIANGTSNSATSDADLTFNTGNNTLSTINQNVSGLLRVSNTGEIQVEGDWLLVGDPTSLLTSNDWYGEAVTFGGAGSSTQFSVYYWTSSSTWALADADSSTTSSGFLGMAVGTAFNNGMLLRGYIYNSSWNWTAGSILYLDVTAGNISSAQPAGSGDIVRVIGYAINADLIYFNPSQEWIELV
jgi:hypothetical protein